jgi:hypothetical protein
MKNETYTCDGCGRRKGDTEWFRVIESDCTFQIWLWGVDDTITVEGEILLHVCSDKCASALAGKWLRKIQEARLIEKAQRAETPVQRETETVQ